jgi:diguanylate cyclase (GGDEF)-like protein
MREDLNKYLSNKLYALRFYALGRERYQICMGELFITNLVSLRQTNMIIACMSVLFSFFPIIVERNWVRAGVFFVAAFVALAVSFAARRAYQMHTEGRSISKTFIYALILLFYTNLVLFGIYIGVWSNHEHFAATLLVFLIIAFFMYTIPPTLNLCLTTGAVTVFVVSSIIVKEYQVWIFDLTNGLLAGSVSLIFSWLTTMHRMSATHSAIRLEEERNNYYNQSTTDELTELPNRRDFMQTFQRYLENYRSTDENLCLALIDIDYFKNYNDFYGHPKGDECLRDISAVLGSLKESMGVYAARVGGEEFALLWFESLVTSTGQVSSTVHNAIRDLNIPHAKSKIASRVTISMGIHITRCGSTTDKMALYEAADKSLYAAKSGGRNCTRISDERMREGVTISHQ